MAKKILIGIVVVVVLLLVVIATRPSSYTVSRSTTIEAAPEAVYPLVAEFPNWPKWSPWEELDPDMEKSFSGTPGAVGSTYEWTGNDQVGKGKMTVTAAEPPRSVDMKLEFIEPFASTSDTGFRLEPTDGGTEVTWTMTSHNNFMAKAFSLVMDFESMIGKDFERGLGKLEVAVAGTAGAMTTDGATDGETGGTTDGETGGETDGATDGETASGH